MYLLALAMALLAEDLANFIGYGFGLRAFMFCPFAFLVSVEIFGKIGGIFMAVIVGSLYSRATGFRFLVNAQFASLAINLLFLMCPARKMLIFIYWVALYGFCGPCDGWMFFADAIYSFAMFCLIMKLQRL
jgi:hypothetical protein